MNYYSIMYHSLALRGEECIIGIFCNDFILVRALTLLAASWSVLGETRHTVAFLRSFARLTCTTNQSSSTRWDFIPTGSNQRVSVYNGVRLSQQFIATHRHTVHTNDGESVLEINSVQLNDRGKYNCFVPPKVTLNDEIELTVLDIEIPSSYVQIYVASLCTVSFIAFIAIISCILRRSKLKGGCHKCHDELSSVHPDVPTPENDVGLCNIHSVQDLSDYEPIPPPLPAYHTRCEDVEQLPPETPIVTSARNQPYLTMDVFDMEKPNQIYNDVREQNQPEGNNVVYAELAVNVRPEGVHRTFNVDQGSRAVYASIDHRINTTKNI
jgi:hypothetical protein